MAPFYTTNDPQFRRVNVSGPKRAFPSKPKKPKKIITIKRWNSRHAHSFEDNERIHWQEFNEVKNLLDKQLEAIERKEQKTDTDALYWERGYNTIGVFGGRGSGKTSLLYSLVEEYRKERQDKVFVLPVIDPTVVSEKNNIFLLVVALINNAVTKTFENKELSPGAEEYTCHRDWKNCVTELAYSIPALDNVGSTYATENWNNEMYINDRGLKAVNDAFHLECNFRRFVDKALNILKKEAFLLVFDDIDVSMKQGWKVLEALRKYVTSPNMLCVVSGNFQLYRTSVRLHQLEQFEKLRDGNKSLGRYEALVDELEEQYLLKLIKAGNRIMLPPFSDALLSDKQEYLYQESKDNDAPDTLKATICKAFNEMGILDDTELQNFVSVVLGLPQRSLFQFLENATQANPSAFKLATIFSARMSTMGIPVDTYALSPDKINMVILSYLLAHTLLAKAKGLVPFMSDEDTDECLTGLNLFFAEHAKNYPYVVLDYMLLVGFVKTIAELSHVPEEQRVSLFQIENQAKNESWQLIISMVRDCLRNDGKWTSLENILAEGKNRKMTPLNGYMLAVFATLATISTILRVGGDEPNTVKKSLSWIKNGNSLCGLTLVREGKPIVLGVIVDEMEAWAQEYYDDEVSTIPPYRLERMVSTFFGKTYFGATAPATVTDAINAFLDAMGQKEYSFVKSPFTSWLKRCPLLQYLP